MLRELVTRPPPPSLFTENIKCKRGPEPSDKCNLVHSSRPVQNEKYHNHLSETDVSVAKLARCWYDPPHSDIGWVTHALLGPFQTSCYREG